MNMGKRLLVNLPLFSCQLDGRQQRDFKTPPKFELEVTEEKQQTVEPTSLF